MKCLVGLGQYDCLKMVNFIRKQVRVLCTECFAVFVHAEINATFEDLFECRPFIYAPVDTHIDTHACLGQIQTTFKGERAL